MINFDNAEVQKFDAMAQHWWDPQGPCKPLHLLNPVRLQFIQSRCDLFQKSILDVGCGGGILTESLSQFSPHVVGIDLSQNALDIAKAHTQLAELRFTPTYVKSTAEDYAKTHPQSFEVITCMELLEHVPHPTLLLQALATLLKPGGDLFISTLNRTPKAFLQAIIGAEYLLRLLPIGTHEYHRFIKPSEIAQSIRDLNLKIKAIQGIEYHLFTQTFSLSPKTDVNYLMHLKKESPI